MDVANKYVLNDDFVSRFKELLASPKKIMIIPHKNPDGDAMGSSLGMMHYLRACGMQAEVLSPTEYPDFLKWLPGDKEVTCLTEQTASTVQQKLSDADIIVCVDFNTLKRVDEMGEWIAQSKAYKILIDHHQQPDDSFDLGYSNTSSCATCQMVFEVIEKISGKDILTPEMATCLYTGIMTDTGSFRFPSTTSQTHRIIADLIDAGAVNSAIHQSIYDTNTLDRLRLVGFSLSERLKRVEGVPAAYISLSREDIRRFNFKKGDSEGLVNYALSIQGIRMAGFFREEEDKIKISLRSKGDLSVNQLARENFNGGGHINAAGGISTLGLEETIRKFEEIAKNASY